MTSVKSRPPSGATWREWLGLIALMLPVFMIATDMTVLFLAMPSIAADLGPSGTQLLWILHIGEFLAAGCVITMGRLTDRIGRRRLLMIGVAGYGAASVLAALSTSPEMLIAARALLGVSAATVMPSGMALLRNMFHDARQFSLAFAVYLSAFSGGMALGPPLGGVLLEYFWWGAVFLANVPAAVLLLMAAPFLLPVYRDPSAQRLDVASVVLSISALMALIFGLQEIADEGLRPLYVGAVLLGLSLGAVFVRRQKRLSDSLLDLRLFADPAVSVSMVSVLFILLAFGGTDMLFAQHLQVVLGLSPAQAGAVLMVPAVASIAGTMLAPVAVRFMRPAYAISSGLGVAVLGALGMVLFLPGDRVFLLMTALVLIGLGASPAMTLSGQLVVTSAPVERDRLRHGGPGRQRRAGQRDGTGLHRQSGDGDLPQSAGRFRAGRTLGRGSGRRPGERRRCRRGRRRASRRAGRRADGCGRCLLRGGNPGRLRGGGGTGPGCGAAGALAAAPRAHGAESG